VIVQFSNPATSSDQQSLHNLGGVHTGDFPLIQASAITVSPDRIADLANLPNVAFVTLDRPVAAALDFGAATTSANIEWNYGFNGAGIGVGVIDSGIYPHGDLKGADFNSRIVYRQSFTSAAAADAFGHGTHVAGIVGSNGWASTSRPNVRPYRGVAPRANLIDLQVLDQNGQGNDSGVIAAIHRAIELKDTYNIRVINLSLGRPVYESYELDPLCRAVAEAWKAGIVVVAAAGNLGRNGYGTVVAPGNSPYVITVGAMNMKSSDSRADDQIASYSSKGPTQMDLVVKPDLVAPGNTIVSLLAPQSRLEQMFPDNRVDPVNPSGPFFDTGNQYFRLSGTSMAVPVVSGTVALMLQQDPTLTPDTVKARLMKTASKEFPSVSSVMDPVTGTTYTSQSDLFTVGAGYLDIVAVLSSTDNASLPSLSPKVTYDPVRGPRI
jgi:serine protease AprX